MIFIYIGIIISFLGLLTGTCTMGSSDEVIVGVILSLPFYLFGCIRLYSTRYIKISFLLSLPAIPFILWILLWSIELFINTNIHKYPICNWKEGYDFGVLPTKYEYFVAPYFVTISSILMFLVIRLFLQFRKVK